MREVIDLDAVETLELDLGEHEQRRRGGIELGDPLQGSMLAPPELLVGDNQEVARAARRVEYPDLDSRAMKRRSFGTVSVAASCASSESRNSGRITFRIFSTLV